MNINLVRTYALKNEINIPLRQKYIPIRHVYRFFLKVKGKKPNRILKADENLLADS